MKSVFLASVFFLSAQAYAGGSDAFFTEEESMVLVDGDTASELYQRLDVTELPGAQEGVSLKIGKNLRCNKVVVQDSTDYSCRIGLAQSVDKTKITGEVTAN